MPPLLKLAIAQLKPAKGDYRRNLTRLGSVFREMEKASEQPHVLSLPETALTGYFLEGGVRENAVTAGTLAKDLDAVYRAHVSSPRRIDVTLGFYERWNNTLYNSAAYVTLGEGDPQIVHVHRKLFLPTYGLFDEERFVERGHSIRAFDTSWGRAALLVCEDAWHSLSGTLAALDGAKVIFVAAAPPARGVWSRDHNSGLPASVERWERLIREMAEEHGVYVVLTNLVGSEGGKVFPGASLIVGPSGEIQARASLWDEAVLLATVDLADVGRARADTPLLADLETMLPHLRGTLDQIRDGVSAPVVFDAAPCSDGAAPRPESTTSTNGTLPFIRIGPPRDRPPTPVTLDGPLTEQWLVQFIRDEMSRRGFQAAVVGVSGGVDSAVTAALAARALGKDNVIGVQLPYRTSSPESTAHGKLVIDWLGIKHRTIDISRAVDGYLAEEAGADPTRRGNVMARVRMIALFDLAAKHKAIPLGTGNKSERLLGYFTWHADDSPPINPLGDLYKTQVWALARHLGVPDPIVSKPPTADLVAGQTDEGDFGISYAEADEILNWLVSGYRASDLVARGFAESKVDIVVKRLESTHWKRRLPTVAMVSPTAIGESYLRPVDY